MTDTQTEQLAVFQSPGRYVQGRNASAQLADELARLGISGSVLILAGRAAEQQLRSTWEQSFASAGLALQVVSFGGSCTSAEIDRVREIAQQEKAVAIVGAGGGQVLDTSRAVAADLDLPAINCPTLASSDAPCSALSVLYTEEHEFAEYRFYRSNPALVLVDTSVIARAPKRFLVSGLGDAVATWWEAKTVREAATVNQLHGLPTATGTALAELCYRLLLDNATAALAAATKGVVTPALERVVEANTLLSGLGFESGGLAAAHSVHNGLTALQQTQPYMHGEKVAFGLLTQLVLEGRSQHDIFEVLQFLRDVGLPTCLADVGLAEATEADIERVAETSVAPGETIHHEPFPVTAAAVADAIWAASELGQPNIG